jgi:hypothetical protein
VAKETRTPLTASITDAVSGRRHDRPHQYVVVSVVPPAGWPIWANPILIPGKFPAYCTREIH